MNFCQKKTAVIILFFLTMLNLSAQVNHSNTQFNYIFEDLPDEIDFHNIGFQDLLEDHQGYLWMATWYGLVRYDGYSMKVYRQQTDNKNGLQSNNITSVFNDSHNDLWVGTTYSGFYRYNRELETFKQFNYDSHDKNSIGHNNVWQIAEDKAGLLWIATENGLFRFNPETEEYSQFLSAEDNPRTLTHNSIYSLAILNDGSIWVGTEDGLCRVKNSSGETSFVRHNLSPPGSPVTLDNQHNFIYKIIPSSYEENVFWVCTSIGLKKVKYSSEDFQLIETKHWSHDENNPNSFRHPFVSAAYEENKDQIWVATYNGLNLLNHKTNENQQFFSKDNDPKTLNGNYVTGLGKDRYNNLWIGLVNSINKLNLNPKKFQNIKSTILDNSITISCIANASDKKGIWAGSHGNGLNYLPINEGRIIEGKPLNFLFTPSKVSKFASVISDIAVDEKDGYLWVATDGAGVIRIKENSIPSESTTLTNFEHFSDKDQLVHNYVMSVCHSISGDTWIGYWGDGLGRYEKEKGIFHNYQFSKGLETNFKEFPAVHLIETVEKGQNYLWIGTRGGGLIKVQFDESNNALELVRHYKYGKEEEKGALSNNFINSFLLDRQGRLWIATDTGLNLFDKEMDGFILYNENDGLKNESIGSILSDEYGNIWVSTRQGVSNLVFSEDTVEVNNFEVFDGLQNNFFMDDAATTSMFGHLVFGGINGFSIFQADEIFTDSLVPKVLITDFKLANQSVPIGKLENENTILSKSITETKHIELSHLENVFSIEFKGLHFRDPQKIQYAYQLEGINADWVYTDASQRIAQYNNLPYDDFIFKVKAANSDGVWSEPVELKLSVSPPFWLSIWAYLIYSLFVIGLIYLGIRAANIRAKYRHTLELERLEKEKIQELNREKLQFFTNISHELRTPLTLIISPLEQLISNTHEKKENRLFTRMHFNANRLLNMINQLLDFRKSEAGLMQMKVEEGNIVDFAKEIKASFNNFAKQKNIELQFSASSKQIMAWYDPVQLEKVFYNLLSNSFKFTKEKGVISVHIEEKDTIEISVKDSGIGIPNAQLEKVFDRFFQVENMKKSKVKRGTGIGLSLTKMIVEKHQGKIWVESEEEKGTTFYIQLLRGQSHFTEEELLPSNNLLEAKSEFAAPDTQVIMSNQDATTKESGNEVIVQEKKSKPCILIVEDNSDIRSYLRENLEHEYSVIEAEDGKEGLEKAIDQTPSLIIADIAMPIMDGIELCAKIKSTISTSHIPLILLTARTSLVFKVDGLETGADDYVTKPFNMQLLLIRVNNLIQSRRKLQEQFSKKLGMNPSEIAVTSLDEELLERVKRVIEKHMDQSDFTVEKLAAALNMTRLQLYRKLRGLTGMPPNKIIRKLRIQRAAQLLKSGQYNVSDVTYMVGYNDLKSFRQQFKKEFGMIPSNYLNKTKA